MQRKPLNEIFGQSTKPSLDEIFSIQKPIETKEPNYFQRVGAQFERAGERAVAGVQESADTISSGISKTLQGDIRQGVREMQTGALRGGLRAVGSVAGAAFAPILEAPGIKEATEAVVSKAVEVPAVQQITQRGMELAQKYPQASKDIEDFINIATLGLGKAASEPIQNIVTESAKSVARIPSTVAKQAKNLKGYASSVAEKSIKKDVADLFNSTRGISNKVKLAEQKGTNLQEIVSDPQIFRGLKVQNAKINPDEAIEIIDNRVEKLLEAKQKTLPEIDRFTSKTPKNVVRERAIANITGKFTPADEADLINAIDQQLAPLPNELSVQELDSLRARFRNSARDARGLQKRSSEYSALENATRDTVFDITDNLPIDTAGEYKALNQYVKNMLNTKQFLDETLRNQVVKGGRLRNYTMKAIGAVAGSQGGVLGAIGGAEVGGVVADIITNNQLGSSIKMRLIRNITDDPVIIKQAEDMLKKVESYQPRLPAGTPGAPRIDIKSGKQINLPEKTQSTRDIEEAQRLSPSNSFQNTAISTTNTNSIAKASNNKEGLSNKLSTAVKKAKKNLKIPNSQAGFAQLIKTEPQLTTKLLKKLEGRTTVSKQFISDLTNSPDLKQAEKDLIRDVLSREGNTVNVQDFSEKVRGELLPLKVVDQKISKAMAKKELQKLGFKWEKDLSGDVIITDKSGNMLDSSDVDRMNPEVQSLFNSYFGYAQDYSQLNKPTRYENITLPDELRGKVKNYKENVYESPIQTSAGDVHFGGSTKNYFGHTRIEDMADNKTRRVIEVQSDLYQKGNLEREVNNYGTDFTKAEARYRENNGIKADKKLTDLDMERINDLIKQNQGVAKLQQYNNPTAHFRMIREEIKKAAQDGKTKLQFPTGETAMKIEGLGQTEIWREVSPQGTRISTRPIKPEELVVGKTVQGNSGYDWIITDVLGDGKFKAVSKKLVDLQEKNWKIDIDNSEVASGGNPAWRAFNEKTGDREFVSFTPDKKEKALEFLKSKIGGDGDLARLSERYGETFDISGKVDTNNPIYKFYEKDLGKYLSSKYNAKLVTDKQGVKWYEVDITPEMKGAVEAFGKAQLGAVSKIGIGSGIVAGAAALKRKLDKKKANSK